MRPFRPAGTTRMEIDLGRAPRRDGFAANLAAAIPAWALPRPSLALRDAAPSLGRVGALEVRLARSAKEIRRAQRLRYRVFFEEMSAVAGPAMRLSRRDQDLYDAACDHLLVLDHDVAPKPFRSTKPKVVGTCRLLRQEVAEAQGGFYSAGEFALGPLLARHPAARFVEIGRACIGRSHRGKKTVELLWQGIWAYVLRTRSDALIGCASLDGTDLAALAPQLSFLRAHALSPEPWAVRALPARRAAIELPRAETIDARAAFKALPPLIKGYLRVGATFGEDAVVDRRFGTTDVFTVLPVAAISPRYLAHFGPAANRYPA